MKRTLIAAACLVLAAPVALSAPAYATTPCYMLTNGAFSATEFADWYNGPRWGASLSTVEDTYAGCAGVWSTNPDGDWNGRVTQDRVWPRADGGETIITFAKFSTAPTWRAHDSALTHSGDYSSYRRECEWPRPAGDPCTPS